jgi:hypothetical protein
MVNFVFNQKEIAMFTIFVLQKGKSEFVGSIKEVPLLGKCQATSSEELVEHFKKEIKFLTKGRPDLKRAKIDVCIEIV